MSDILKPKNQAKIVNNKSESQEIKRGLSQETVDTIKIYLLNFVPDGLDPEYVEYIQFKCHLNDPDGSARRKFYNQFLQSARGFKSEEKERFNLSEITKQSD